MLKPTRNANYYLLRIASIKWPHNVENAIVPLSSPIAFAIRKILNAFCMRT